MILSSGSARGARDGLAFDLTRESLSAGRSRARDPHKQSSTQSTLLRLIRPEGLEKDPKSVIVNDPGGFGKGVDRHNTAALYRGITQHLSAVNEASTNEQ